MTDSSPGSRYAHHLAAGLAAYEEHTGRRPEPDALDVTRPEIRALYDQFRARPFRTRLGATDGEWAALRLGLKSVLRERIDEAHLAALRVRCRDEGLLVRTEPIPAPRSSALDGVATAPVRAMHVYVGRLQDDIDEAAAIDGRMVPFQSVDRGAPHNVTLQDNRRLGELLGYPTCCVQWFGQWHEHLVSNWEPIAAAAAASERFEPLLNSLVLGGFHCIGWFPCRFDCPASLRIARQVRAEVVRARPSAVGGAVRALSLTHIYVDERRQLLLDGDVRDGRVHVARAFTPYAQDRRASTAAYEWVFFADVMPLVQRGDTVWLDGEDLVVALAGVELGRLNLPGAIWLPFGG